VQRVTSSSRVLDHGVRVVSGDNGAEVSSNGGGDNADGGESVGLAQKLLPVT
jgi:translation elongation factor EF-G